jgi:hypothetical protein
MSSTGCLTLAIEPTLLGVGMAPIWASIMFGATCPEPPYVRSLLLLLYEEAYQFLLGNFSHLVFKLLLITVSLFIT